MTPLNKHPFSFAQRLVATLFAASGFCCSPDAPLLPTEPDVAQYKSREPLRRRGVPQSYVVTVTGIISSLIIADSFQTGTSVLMVVLRDGARFLVRRDTVITRRGARVDQSALSTGTAIDATIETRTRIAREIEIR